MKIKVISLLLLCASSFATAHEENNEKIKALEKRITVLEKLLNSTKDPSTQTLKKVNPAETDSSLLALSKWSYNLEKGDFGSNYNIKYHLKNNYKKNIKLLDASINFNDLLGEHLYGIKVDPDLKIKSGTIKIEGGLYRINQFIAKQGRMAKMEKKDIIANLVVRKIVFDDNTVLEP